MKLDQKPPEQYHGAPFKTPLRLSYSDFHSLSPGNDPVPPRSDRTVFVNGRPTDQTSFARERTRLPVRMRAVHHLYA